MTTTSTAVVPVWTLATGEAHVPTIADDGPMSAERLAALRSVLATYAERPIATLEAHPLPAGLDRRRGIALEAASPLAQQLSQLVTETAQRSSAVKPLTESGEVLYRFVAPASLAKEVGAGSLRRMSANDVAGGMRSALVDSSRKIVGHGSYVPLTGAASKGAVVATSVAGATALTVAAPLVLAAVAVGLSARAEQERRQAVERIGDLLEQLQDAQLDRERSDLEGCRDAIDKATAILLDQSRLGISLGLDSAVHEIGRGLAAAERRLERWKTSLAGFPADAPVEVSAVTDAFPGIDDEVGGRFRAHLELAGLAIALKRRVVVLQAVDHAQSDPANPFESFARALKADQARLDELESGIASVLFRLSSLELTRPMGLRRSAFTGPQVDRLLATTRTIRALGDGVATGQRDGDVAIEIAQQHDGSLTVFPAQAA